MEKKRLILVTHGGLSHADEVLAISIVLSKEWNNYSGVTILRTGCNIPSEYRDNKQNEIWVIDCGLLYEPKNHRFDHHDKEYTSDCSFSQIAKYYSLDEVFSKYLPWYNRVIISDNLGFAFWFKSQKEKIRTDTAQALTNPFEGYIKNIFGDTTTFESDGKHANDILIFKGFGDYIISTAFNRKEDNTILEKKFKIYDKVGYINSGRVITTLTYYGKQKRVEVILTTSNSGREENKGCIGVLSTNSSRINLNNIDFSSLGKVNYIHKQGQYAVIDPETALSDTLLENLAKILNEQINNILSKKKPHK